MDPGPLDLRLALYVLRAGQHADLTAALVVALHDWAESLGRNLDEAASGLGHSATGRALCQASADCARFVADIDHLAGRSGGEQWRSTDDGRDPHAIPRR